MNRFNYLAALAAILVVGCAAAPEQPAAADNSISAGNAPRQAAAESASTETSQGVVGEDEPTLAVIDASDFDPGTVVVCREMLKPASNVVVRTCMSRDDWKRYERALELQAQQMLRQMQGSAFR